MTVLLIILAIVALAALAPRYGADSRELTTSEQSRDNLRLRHRYL